MKNILVILPCYNPSFEDWDRLKCFLEKNNLERFDFQVIDDGSSRWTAPHFDLSTFSVKLERLEKNLGKGGVIKDGIRFLEDRHQVYCFTDFDLPYSYEDLLGIAGSVLQGTEIVIGDRTGEGNPNYSTRLSRGLVHSLFRLAVRMIITGGIGDTQCGLKAFDAGCAKLIASKSALNSFLFDVEWIYIALKHKLAVRCWPVTIQESHANTSLRNMKLGDNFIDSFRILLNILQGRYYSKELSEFAQTRRSRLVTKMRSEV